VSAWGGGSLGRRCRESGMLVLRASTGAFSVRLTIKGNRSFLICSLSVHITCRIPPLHWLPHSRAQRSYLQTPNSSPTGDRMKRLGGWRSPDRGETLCRPQLADPVPRLVGVHSCQAGSAIRHRAAGQRIGCRPDKEAAARRRRFRQTRFLTRRCCPRGVQPELRSAAGDLAQRARRRKENYGAKQGKFCSRPCAVSGSGFAAWRLCARFA
jgi:hypothetical protein